MKHMNACIAASLVSAFVVTIPSLALAWTEAVQFSSDARKGGYLDEVMPAFDKANQNNVLFVLKGKCFSICAILLSANNVCMYPQSTIHFHGIHYKGSDTVLQDDNQKLISSLPIKIQKWVRDNKALDSVKIHKALTGYTAIRLGIANCEGLNIPSNPKLLKIPLYN
jgi:hypothetical protein